MILFGKTKHEWQQLELQYRPEWIIFLVGFILGAIIFQMNKQLTQQNFDEQDITSGFIMNLIKLTQQNIRLGKQPINNERKLNVNRQAHNKDNWIKIRS